MYRYNFYNTFCGFNRSFILRFRYLQNNFQNTFHIFANNIFLASSLLNWSYQNTKACTVLVGENSEAFPASKATTSETNLSTSSRPRPSSSGGNNQIDGVYARKRRDLNVTPHAFVLFSNVTTSSPMENFSSATPMHDSTVLSSTELSLANDVYNATVTNSISDTATDEITTKTSTVEISTSSMTLEDLDTAPSPNHLSEITSEATSVTGATIITNLSQSIDGIISNRSDDDNQKTIEEILDEQIDYEKAFEPDYGDDDDTSLEIDTSPNNITDEVMKVDEEIIEELRQPAKKDQLSESISLKPSDSESAAAIQHDYPIYSYGQDVIEIVSLNHKTVSTTAKSKAAYDRSEVPVKPETKEITSSEELTDFNLAAEEFDPADVINIKSDLPVLQTHDINSTNTNDVASETNKSSKISVIEVPQVQDSLTPSKRIFVNVTIATEPDSPNSPQSIYVLSVSLPTENAPSPEINVNSQSEKRFHNLSSHHESTKNTNLNNEIQLPEQSQNYGGECQCSCPCLDPETSPSPSPSPDVTVQNATDLLSSTTEATIAETSDSSATEETWTTTATQCPEITTTTIPPTPMILILEGRMLNPKT